MFLDFIFRIFQAAVNPGKRKMNDFDEFCGVQEAPPVIEESGFGSPREDSSVYGAGFGPFGSRGDDSSVYGAGFGPALARGREVPEAPAVIEESGFGSPGERPGSMRQRHGSIRQRPSRTRRCCPNSPVLSELAPVGTPTPHLLTRAFPSHRMAVECVYVG